MKAVSIISAVVALLLIGSYAYAVTVTVDFTGTITNDQASIVGPNYTPGDPLVAATPNTPIFGFFTYEYEDVMVPGPNSSSLFPAADFWVQIYGKYLYHGDTGSISIIRRPQFIDAVLIRAPLTEIKLSPLYSLDPSLNFWMALVPRGGHFPSYDSSGFEPGNILTSWDVTMFYPTGSIGTPGLWLEGAGQPNERTNIVFQVDTLHSYPPVPEPSTFALLAGGLAALAFVTRRLLRNDA